MPSHDEIRSAFKGAQFTAKKVQDGFVAVPVWRLNESNFEHDEIAAVVVAAGGHVDKDRSTRPVETGEGNTALDPPVTQPGASFYVVPASWI